MNEYIISIENVSKNYKLYQKPSDRFREALHPLRKKYHTDFHALNSVNLKIKKGETVGIIGKNGSGKSTLLKIIAGVLTPTSGNVEVKGKISAILELGAGFNPEISGLDNIYFQGAILGYSRKEMNEQLESILKFADIGEFIYQPVKKYSSGMFIRLAFSIAININPDILIIDEALAVGDAAFQAKCYNKFREYQEQGKTILFVTHSSDLIIKYCNNALLLNYGEPLFYGKSKDSIELYRKLLVNTSPSINKNKINNDTKNNSIGTNDKQMLQLNPLAIKYGSLEAEIIDFSILNFNEVPSLQLFHNEEYTVSMTVQFHFDIDEPIFAYTIKSIDGLELVGTNNICLNKNTGSIKKGEIVKVFFKQKMILNAGSYMLSLGCTKNQNDSLTVFHRIYDASLFDVVSPINSVGFAYVDSKFTMTKVN